MTDQCLSKRNFHQLVKGYIVMVVIFGLGSEFGGDVVVFSFYEFHIVGVFPLFWSTHLQTPIYLQLPSWNPKNTRRIKHVIKVHWSNGIVSIHKLHMQSFHLYMLSWYKCKLLTLKFYFSDFHHNYVIWTRNVTTNLNEKDRVINYMG